MNLQSLHTNLWLIIKKNYNTGDGNCYLHSILQNLNHHYAVWPHDIPATVDELRKQTIDFMIENKYFYTEIEDAPMTDEQFEELIRDQSMPNSYTDEDGWFIEVSVEAK